MPSERKRKREPSSNSDESEEEREQEQDVRVMSHAAKRKELRKKNREKAATTSSGSGVEKETRQNSVWVGNLAFKTTSESLKAFFRDAGEITRVNLPSKSVFGDGHGMRGENRGFAYVDFATEEAKLKAISMSEKNLDGRRLLIKDGGDFSGRPAATSEGKTNTTNPSMTKTAKRILRSQKQPPCQTLFLGNLGFGTTEDQIREMFEAHEILIKGKAKDQHDEAQLGDKKSSIRKIRMGTFEDTGHCKGFAFVDFLMTELATAALVNPRNHLLNGRKLKVEFATVEAVRRGGGAGGPTRNGDRDPMAGKHHSATKQTMNTDPEEGSTLERPRKRPRIATDDSALLSSKHGRVHRVRPKPGAALALAKRENVAIVQSLGKKIVF